MNYTELLDNGWEVVSQGKSGAIIGLKDTVLKFFRSTSYQKDLQIFDYEPLLELQSLAEVPKLYTYNTEQYLMMERVSGVCLTEAVPSCVNDVLSSIHLYIDNCVELGWLPYGLESDNLYWDKEKKLRVIDFSQYRRTENMKEHELKRRITRLKMDVDFRLSQLSA